MDKVQKIREGIKKLKSQLLRGACSSQVAMETRCKEEAYNEVLSILDTLQEEPVSEDLENAARRYAALQAGMKDAMTSEFYEEYPYSPNDVNAFKTGANWQKKRDYIPLSDDINEVARQICNKVLNCEIDYKEDDVVLSDEEECVKAGIRWQMQKESISSKDLEELINSLSKRYPEISFAKLSRIAVRVAKWQREQDQSTIELAEDHAMLAGMNKMKEQMMAKAVDVEVKVDAGGYPYIPQMELYDYDTDVPLAKEGDRYKVIPIKEE